MMSGEGGAASDVTREGAPGLEGAKAGPSAGQSKDRASNVLSKIVPTTDSQNTGRPPNQDS